MSEHELLAESEVFDGSESSVAELMIRVSDSGLPLGVPEALLPRLDEEDEPWLEVSEMKVLELDLVRVGFEAPELGLTLTTGIVTVCDPEPDL